MPLQREPIIFVPLRAGVEGVVDSVNVDRAERSRISLRLEKLHLPNGQIIKLSTVPLVHQSKVELRTEAVTVRTGLDVDIDRLLGDQAESAAESNRANADAGIHITIPRDSHLVFTLEDDITVPAP